MNILLITNEFSTRNGWATVALELITRLRERHGVTVLSERGDADNPGFDLIASNGFKTLRVLRRDTAEITQRLEGQRFDVIVCAIEPHLPLAARLKRRLSVPRLVLIGQGTYIHYPFVRGRWRWFNRWAARSVDMLVVPSSFTAAKARAWYQGPLEIVPWGVNTDTYHPVPGIEKEQAFLFVGAQKPRKGVGDLLEGFARLVTEYPEARLYLVGQPSERYARRLSELKIESQVIQTGVVSHDELLGYYARCLCHVLPSVNTPDAFEGYGLVHLEANACGIPSIGSQDTANEEIIIDGASGLLCKPHDPESVYRCMRRILNDDGATRRMFDESLRHAHSYTWARVIEAFESNILRVGEIADAAGAGQASPARN
ncbi:hypothetical protein BI364_02665 [Acidihalobacter yilgarnensis]|uniref:Glycosyl transferase family 1 n=1 Tax=Acidihalobacter yilgarnensis TaxID=2819280 RepID=A0A1D8IKY6_9GAMM|nr:glycosyltransferase family 4 protein [Acidihalobacter yilgarnensis]AOU97051.1 hypothetical protein BI364_02665 [Acidihalobacter yilgarnensis]